MKKSTDMKKPTTKKPHKPKARRRVRHPNPAFPGTPGDLGDITETMAGMALVDMMRKMGISPIRVLLTVRSLAGNKRPTSSVTSSINCVCQEECLCHTGDCPNVGTRLDGCHRCDCGNGVTSHAL
jgi:hypothetical protein